MQIAYMLRSVSNDTLNIRRFYLISEILRFSREREKERDGKYLIAEGEGGRPPHS